MPVARNLHAYTSATISATPSFNVLAFFSAMLKIFPNSSFCSDAVPAASPTSNRLAPYPFQYLTSCQITCQALSAYALLCAMLKSLIHYHSFHSRRYVVLSNLFPKSSAIFRSAISAERCSSS